MPFFTGGGSSVTTANIVDGTIVNNDINATAGIQRRKLESAVLVKATKSAGQALGAMAKVTFDTEVTDTENAFAASTFTAPRAMNVLIMVVLPNDSNADTVRDGIIAIRKNGAEVRRVGSSMSGGQDHVNGGMLMEAQTLAINDTIEIYAQSADAGDVQNIISGATGACLTIIEV